MSKWKNNKVDECIVKDCTKARMAFISAFKQVLRHKDKEHLEKYEKLWYLHDHDYSYYLRSIYHNISKDEFADLIFILCTSHYKKRYLIMGYDEFQCYNCKRKYVCNFEAIDYSSTGTCDCKVVGLPIKPKIETPPDERYDNIWNW